MKIALIIFRLGPSHGSILQTYALHKVLTDLGHNVTIIDRQRPIKFISIIVALKRVLLSIKNGNLEIGDFRLGEYPTLVMNPFKAFIIKYLGQHTLSIHKDSELKRIGASNDFDAYVVGSDQTWRPKYVYDVYNFYLDFVPLERKVKRIAYSASFGTSEWEYNEEQELRCKELAQRFDEISVREDSGVKLCKEHLGTVAKHVLDPTMLLKADEYRALLENRHRIKNKYVGYNFLDDSDGKIKIVDDVCSILGTEKYSIISSESKRKSKYMTMPTIEEWLQGIDDASFVIVDSFHATVFSIIFHTNFLTIANVGRGLSRFTSLLGALGLQDRLITEDEQIDAGKVTFPINWDEVDRRLEVLREQSMDFLTSNLN